MKISKATKPRLRIALAESDPLRLVGFRALLESESDLELISASLPEIAIQANIDVVLIGDRPGQNLLNTISHLKMMRPNLPIIVIGPTTDDEIVLNAIGSGAKGYVFDGAPPQRICQGDSHGESRFSLGSTAGTFDVRRTCHYSTEANAVRR